MITVLRRLSIDAGLTGRLLLLSCVEGKFDVNDVRSKTASKSERVGKGSSGVIRGSSGEAFGAGVSKTRGLGEGGGRETSLCEDAETASWRTLLVSCS